MTSIAAVVVNIVSQPAPVLILDACNFLDLFRRDSQRPKAPADEIRSAARLRQLLIVRPVAVHLVVPELVRGEYRDNAAQVEREFDGWFGLQDKNQVWLTDVATSIDVSLPLRSAVGPLRLASRFRQLADDLLSRAIILDRDSGSLDRAFARLLARRRPSHKKEIKDSVNLEQSLEFCSQLRIAGFLGPVAFFSSNTNDFADSSSNDQLHVDLRAEFAAVSLEYFPNLRSSIGWLPMMGELP